MIPQSQLLDFFVEVTDTLVDDFDLVEFLHALAAKAAVVSGAAAVGLVLTDHHDRVRYMASSNEDGKLLELLQIQNDDGPCLDAITNGWQVVNADLGEAGDRWPRFAPAARAMGFQSVHAFPMRVRTQTIGALNIFGTDSTRFHSDEVRVVQALADVATIAIIHERLRHEAELIATQLQNALTSRIVIEQAKGALARAQGITTSQAFDLIRTMARSTGRRLHDVAAAVVDDLDTSGG
ncbi:GAF and ANTAR domain-containing protein [Nocardioides sp.]|uniref:GAF and ANTAR domain-containing protein n=1 Tax=Nocardioides sp. TaxID=35761 RepID=UPI001A20778F|nr:GAF and ANTAR domain-containing protein [Nocardioides sp.]MBJ7357431.1 GAF and ANTAR domain-containing protein [Nocardioides sp.]